MNLTIHGNHIDVSPALRDHIIGKLSRIERHFDQVIDATVQLTCEKLRQRAEITLRVRGNNIHVESVDIDMYAAIDSLVACKFSFFGATLEEYAELLSATTGMEYTPQSLKQIGERIYLTERFYNCANGFAAKDDLLPERFYSEAGSSGDGIDIPPIDRARFMEELQKYYRMRGLTPEGTFADPDFLEKQP